VELCGIPEGHRHQPVAAPAHNACRTIIRLLVRSPENSLVEGIAVYANKRALHCTGGSIAVHFAGPSVVATLRRAVGTSFLRSTPVCTRDDGQPSMSVRLTLAKRLLAGIEIARAHRHLDRFMRAATKAARSSACSRPEPPVTLTAITGANIASRR